MDQCDPILIRRKPFPGCLQCHLITVDADEPAGGEAGSDLEGMSGSAKGAVYINAIGADVQAVDTFLQQHGNMMKFTHRPMASKDASSFSGVRFSISKRLNSSASQISA